jgi:RNA 3'-terminal phosphate cyclase-like protein
MASSSKSEVLRFSSHRHLRQRLLLSVLSGKSIRIDGIRSDDVHVGLREYEINLLRLIEKVTNGSTIEISVTGTSFLFHPGVLPGGSFQHTCHVGRSIGYYLEVLVPLGPFCKKSLDVMLNGVTGEEGRDMTVRGWLYWLTTGRYDKNSHITASAPLWYHRRARTTGPSV